MFFDQKKLRPWGSEFAVVLYQTNKTFNFRFVRFVNLWLRKIKGGSPPPQKKTNKTFVPLASIFYIELEKPFIKIF